ncbi:MAG: IS630 transposase-related protein [Cyanobacteria bacterium J06638_22]
MYRWRQRPSLERTVVTQRRRKLDPAVLRQHVRDYPEARLKDRAKAFGVHPSAIGHALKRHRITVQKNSSATGSATIGTDKPS